MQSRVRPVSERHWPSLTQVFRHSEAPVVKVTHACPTGQRFGSLAQP